MRILLLLLVATTAGAQSLPRFKNDFHGPSPLMNQSMGAVDALLFSFLPTLGTSDYATGVMPASALGDAVTFTRSSTATCTNSAGTMVTLAVNQPCVEANGLRAHPAVTNAIFQSETVDNASWVKSNVTATANSTIAPTNATTADTLATTVAGGYAESTTVASANTTYTASVYARSVTGTQAFALVLYNTTGAAALCTSAVTLTTSFQRVVCTSTSAGGVNMTARLYPGGVAGSGTAVVWGAQVVIGPYESRYVATTTAAATSADERITFPQPAGLSTSKGCTKVCVVPTWTGANPGSASKYYLTSNAPRFAFTGAASANFQLFDGTRTANVSGAYVAGVKKCYVSSWDTGTGLLKVANLASGLSGTTAGFVGFSAFLGNVPVGSSATNPNVWIQDVRMGTSEGMCL